MNTDSNILTTGPVNRSFLKYFAMISMLIDHTGLVVVGYGLMQTAAFSPYYNQLYILYKCMRTLGRLAFPVYLFLLVQGFLYTHDRTKYGLRLFIFALLSEIPFNLAIGRSLWTLQYQNVMWTLFLSFVMMCLLDHLRQSDLHPVLTCISGAVIIGAIALLAWCMRTDYSYKGILACGILYLFRFDRKATCALGALSFFWEPAAMFSFIPVFFYNGKKGHTGKYIFYWFYPVHLLVLYGIQQFVISTV